MKGHEILEKLNALIDRHTKTDANMHQIGYKDDFFSLFLEAYKGGYFDFKSTPRLTGDAMRDYFFANWMQEENEYNKTKLKRLNSLIAMWDEWHYALEKCGVNV